jgi:hypothetical protein
MSYRTRNTPSNGKMILRAIVVSAALKERRAKAAKVKPRKKCHGCGEPCKKRLSLCYVCCRVAKSA